MLETMQIKVINQNYNNFLVSYFSVNKTKKLISQKYYWLSLKKNFETYIKGCNVCLSLKIMRDKLYNNLQLLFLLSNQ